MTTLVFWLMLALAGPEQTPAGPAVDELTRVRELYALASYEEALARLDRAGTTIDAGPAAQYRALCLLGLGRTQDAEQVIEQLVLDVPSFRIPEDQVPPKLAAMFRETRERTLPAAARTRYSQAREAWDTRQLTQAARGFREVQALLADEALVARVEGLRDLKMLSGDFLALAEAEIEKASRPAPAAVAAAAPVAAGRAPVATNTTSPAPAAPAPGPATPAPPTSPEPPAPVAGADAGAVYSEVDTDVIAPEEISRRLPYWNPPAALATQEFRGRLDVVVDEAGGVVSATLIDSVHPQFDGPLVEAARRWQFRPATRGGAPVRYRKTFEIVLNRR